MLTAKDICARYKISRKTLGRWHVFRTFPAPLMLGGVFRWREEDVALWEEYLAASARYRRETGLDPNASDSLLSPPVFSHGVPMVDAREVNARREERERASRSKTLAAASVGLPAEQEPADRILSYVGNAQKRVAGATESVTTISED